RTHPQGLSRASRRAGRELPQLYAAARDRRAQGHDRRGGRRMSIAPRPPIPSITPLSPAEAARLVPGLIDLPAPEADDAPWHDPAMALADRMTLAAGKPLPRRMMAAMAQQDCGQCGYNCKDYAAKLFDKSETRLTLCVPGGKDTARMLKQLYAELEPATAPVAEAPAAPRAAAPAGR